MTTEPGSPPPPLGDQIILVVSAEKSVTCYSLPSQKQLTNFNVPVSSNTSSEHEFGRSRQFKRTGSNELVLGCVLLVKMQHSVMVRRGERER